MVRGGHTQGGSRNTPLALLTGHFHSNTHTQCKGVKPPHCQESLSPSPPLHPSPPPPYPSPHLLSLYPSPFTSQSSLSSSENSSFFSVRANLKLLSPLTIKNQAGCRKRREEEGEERENEEGEGGGGGREGGGSGNLTEFADFTACQIKFKRQIEVQSSIFNCSISLPSPVTSPL